MTNNSDKPKTPSIKAVCFDFMGTCLDWHTSILRSLPPSTPQPTQSQFALDWRNLTFESIAQRHTNGSPPEDIDVTNLRTLETLLTKPEYLSFNTHFSSSETRAIAVKAWHTQRAWDDVNPALKQLRSKGIEIFVHANGTTRLQLDLTRSSGLAFDMLFSSEMLGVYKPSPESYGAVMRLIRRRPEECVMVAAHAYDLVGAKGAGMRTVYVCRWSDDVGVDMGVVRGEVDVFLEDMSSLDDVILGL